MYKAKIVLTVLLLGMFLVGVACTNEDDVKENVFWDSSIKDMEENFNSIIELLESRATIPQITRKGYEDSPQSKQVNAAIASFKDDFSTLKNNYEQVKLKKKGKIKIEKKREYNEELLRLNGKVNAYFKEIDKLVEEYDVLTKNLDNTINYIRNNR